MIVFPVFYFIWINSLLITTYFSTMSDMIIINNKDDKQDKKGKIELNPTKYAKTNSENGTNTL